MRKVTVDGPTCQSPFLFLSPSLVFFFSSLFQRESREKREEKASGAAALRWLEGGDVGVHACPEHEAPGKGSVWRRERGRWPKRRRQELNSGE
jgi:hypothetical protein